MAGESCREEEHRRLVSTLDGDCRGGKRTLDSHRLLSEFVVKSLQTLVGVVKFPPGLLLKRTKSLHFYSVLQRSIELLSVRLTHRVGGYSQTLLDQPLKGGLQDQVLVGDGLLHNFLSWDRL